ncbi:MAG: PAS domain S-box protein, partial [Eggerthella lenta]
HVHASNPYRAMRDERYFPFEAGRQTYEYLQQLVREKTATIDLLTDNITGGLKMSEDDDVYTLSYVNEGLARMLGYTIEELMEVSGGTAVGMVHAPDRAQALADVARCFAEAYVRDGVPRPQGRYAGVVLDSGRKVQTEDGAVKIGSVLMDITSRKEAEIALAVERGATASRCAALPTCCSNTISSATCWSSTSARPARTAARFPRSVGSSATPR